jgi:hypothetical protein
LSQGRFREATQHYRSWAELSGRDADLLARTVDAVGAAVAAGSGQSPARKRALDGIDAIRLRFGRTYHDDILAAELLAALGEASRALDILEPAAAEGQLMVFLFDPAYDKIRNHPRYQRLLERVGAKPVS